MHCSTAQLHNRPVYQYKPFISPELKSYCSIREPVAVFHTQICEYGRQQGEESLSRHRMDRRRCIVMVHSVLWMNGEEEEKEGSGWERETVEMSSHISALHGAWECEITQTVKTDVAIRSLKAVFKSTLHKFIVPLPCARGFHLQLNIKVINHWLFVSEDSCWPFPTLPSHSMFRFIL